MYFQPCELFYNLYVVWNDRYSPCSREWLSKCDRCAGVTRRQNFRPDYRRRLDFWWYHPFRCFRSPSSSPTCLLSGTIGIVPARRNGSASAIRAVMSHADKSPSLICTLIHLLGGTVHFRRFKWLGPFRPKRIADPTCPNKEVWILAMLYVMFYVVSIL